MDWTRYRFRTQWSLPAKPTAVYDVLEQAEDYPRWWPQVREVRRDREAGVLEIAMTGDLDGWARWTITADGDGSLARYDQVTEVHKPLLRRFAVPGRPVFLANHRLMMRAGRRGLVAHLEAV